jgi:hypothetical protein
MLTVELHRGKEWSFTGNRREEEAARVAQLVEHTLGKGEVIGSIPIASLYYNESQLRKK